MATDALDSPSWSSNARSLVDRESVGALVLTAAIPFLFIHERFQPELAIAVGSTSIEIRLADWAILAVVAVALITAVRRGTKPLAAGRLLWISGVLLIGWLAFAALRPAAMDDARFDEHLVSYLKFVEYALLAIAVPLVVRRPRDLTLVLLGVVLWSAVATGVALLQLLGSDIFSVSSSGWRYASFLGRHDLAALSALAASLAAARIVTGRNHVPAIWLVPLAAIAGVLGLVLAGSVAAAGGFAIGAVGLWIAARHRFAPSRRQTAALVATVVTVALGVVMIRSEALNDFLRFVGLHGDDTAQGVETYSQRTVLAYIGLRIAQDSPIVGVGWQRSSRPEVFEPYVDDARERFPDVVDLAFPTEEDPWGVQNLYIQVLADAGAIGLALLLFVGAAGLVLAWRAAARAPTPWAAGAGLVVICALLTLGAEWASLGIVAGIPLQAATCLLLGVAAAGAAAVENAPG
ncbi:MAG: O-antigen ligase family protein [Gaiellaceae bacterium]